MSDTWTCGACGQIVDGTHFYSDAFGVMHHESDEELRRLLKRAVEHYGEEHRVPQVDYRVSHE